MYIVCLIEHNGLNGAITPRLQKRHAKWMRERVRYFSGKIARANVSRQKKIGSMKYARANM